jgi:glycosyltransferase involved in cell wall biosynthesis
MSSDQVLHIAKMTGIAGMENHLLSLLPALRTRGLDPRLIILTEPDKPMHTYAEKMIAGGVPTEQIPMRRDFDPALIGTLAKRMVGVNAVHTHLIHADLHGLLAAKRAGVRRIYSTGHNDDAFRRKLPIRLFQGWFWRQVSAGIAISEALRQFMLRAEFAPPDRIRTVYYGYEPPQQRSDAATRLRVELNLPPETPVLASVCRLVEQKGLIYAVQAFKRVQQSIPKAHYVIVGDGHLRAELESAAQGANIHFLGWRADARDLMPAFDALVMPSLWEGFGLVALEAMAHEVPVIASYVSALPEIVVDEQTGYLVPPQNTDALAERMADMLQNPVRAGKMGEAARRRVETEFSISRMVDGTLRVYGLS